MSEHESKAQRLKAIDDKVMELVASSSDDKFIDSKLKRLKIAKETVVLGEAY